MISPTPAPRAVILTGAGGEFCAGADLTGGDGGVARTHPGHILHGMRVLADAVQSVHDCPVPVVAKVDGVCVGAGLGLALATDMIWCSDRARFSAIFAKRGLSLDFGTSWLLRQRIGIHKAKEIAFTGRVISASDALSLGLVNAVVPQDELDRATREIVDGIAAGPPVALSDDQTTAGQRRRHLLGPGTRSRSAGPERECTDRRHEGSIHGLCRTPTSELLRPIGPR